VALNQNTKEFTVIDLFSGCGGLTEGLHQIEMNGHRYRTLAAVDIWDAACDTLEANFPDVTVFREGLSESVITKLKDLLGGKELDLVVGGPPCQGFSTSGKRALDDPRNLLVKMYLKTIAELQPRAFLMENVVGFTTFQKKEILRGVLDEARALEYTVYPAIVQASLYGVPQRRRRFVLVGVRNGEFRWPDFVDAKTGRPKKDSISKYWPRDLSPHELFVQDIPEGFDEVTFNVATQDLPGIESGEASEKYEDVDISENWFVKYARKKSGPALTAHKSPQHADHLIEMMQLLDEGQSAFEKFEEGNRLRPTSGFSNSYTRIKGDQPAPTITRNFTTPSSANCIHPKQNRALTPREGARMQSFRDRYKFEGSSTEQRLQIGNAVPPLLAKAIGKAIMRNLITTL
jgi:DNA (cytosine-5)-methyltransferase 1